MWASHKMLTCEYNMLRCVLYARFSVPSVGGPTGVVQSYCKATCYFSIWQFGIYHVSEYQFKPVVGPEIVTRRCLRSTDTTTLPVRRLIGRLRLSGGCSTGVEQSATRDSSLLLTFDIPKGDQVSTFELVIRLTWHCPFRPSADVCITLTFLVVVVIAAVVVVVVVVVVL